MSDLQKFLRQMSHKLGCGRPGASFSLSSSSIPRAVEAMESDKGLEIRLKGSDSAALAESRVLAALRDDLDFKALISHLRRSDRCRREKGFTLSRLAIGGWHNLDSGRDEPLVLIPVNISTRGGPAVLTVTSVGRAAYLNPRLRKKLGLLGIPISVDPSTTDPCEIVAQLTRELVATSEIRIQPDSFAIAEEKESAVKEDLGSEWDDRELPREHPIHPSYGDSAAPVKQSESLLKTFSRGEPFDSEIRQSVLPITDLDCSQKSVLHTILQGDHLIVEGPPGTGKSQVIANAAAQLAALGKSTLIVCAKEKALDVLERTLRDCGLGDAVLNVSRLESKRQVLEQFKFADTEEVGGSDPINPNDRALASAEEALNNYYARLPDIGCNFVPSNFKPDPEILAWIGSASQDQYEAIEQSLVRFSSLVTTLGNPTHHPVYAMGIESVSPTTSRTLHTELLPKLLETANALSVAVARFESTLGIKQHIALRSLRSWVVLLKETANSSAMLETIGCTTEVESWIDLRETDITAPAGHVENLRRIRTENPQIPDEAWVNPYANEAEIVTRSTRELLPWFTPRLWSAHRRILTLAPRITQLFETARSIDNYRRVYQSLKTDSARLLSILGQDIQLERCDSNVFDALTIMRRCLREGLLDNKLSQAELSSFLAVARSGSSNHNRAHAASMDAYRTWREAGQLTVAVLDALDVASDKRRPVIKSASDFCAYVVKLKEGLGKVSEFREFRGIMSAAEKQPAMAKMLAAILSQDKIEMGSLKDQLLRQLRYNRSYAKLSIALDGAQNPETLRETLDAVWEVEKGKNRQNVRLKIGQHAEVASSSARAFMLEIKDCGRRKSKKTLRGIFGTNLASILKMKPIVLATPDAVASLFPRKACTFDVVIFDEASQLEPADAVGAAIRGRQIVVVGDRNQLPPTNFFADTPATDQEDESGGDAESFLDFCEGRQLTKRSLLWHYRSQHESLILVSNREMYNGRLRFPPATHARGDEYGLQFQYISDAVYDRGNRCTNEREAHSVVEAAKIHFERWPHQTLLICTMNQNQRDLIEECLENEFDRYPNLREAFRSGGLFLRSLEECQGEEADAVFVSITYGNASDGTFSQNFGPLGRDGGERRLNVIMTRARKRTVIFSSIRFGAIEGRSRGSSLLKKFLVYAETGECDFAEPTGRDPDSPLEIEVIEALRSRGYKVVPQVGVSGFRIDMAIVDPKAPGRYILGIETDGATYHSHHSAVSRDVLRQRHLESKGWAIHRVWSTNWFQDPKGEIEKIVKKLSALTYEE